MLLKGSLSPAATTCENCGRQGEFVESAAIFVTLWHNNAVMASSSLSLRRNIAPT